MSHSESLSKEKIKKSSKKKKVGKSNENIAKQSKGKVAKSSVQSHSFSTEAISAADTISGGSKETAGNFFGSREFARKFPNYSATKNDPKCEENDLHKGRSKERLVDGSREIMKMVC